MNRKLLKAGLAGVAALGVLAGGSTFAAWSDFGQVNGNETEAGHLKLTLGTPSGSINNVGGQAIAPGEYRTIDFFVASADLDGVPTANLSMAIKNLTDKENGCGSASEAALEDCTVNPGEFSSQGYVRIRYSNPAPVGSIVTAPNSCTAPSGYVNSVGYTPASDNDPTHYPRLSTLTGNSALGTLAGNEGVCVRIDLGLDDNATNVVQTDSSTFDLQFDLVQA